MTIAKNWEAEVRVNGEPVLTIGSGHLSGVNDLDPYSDTIRYCAESLIGFIGPLCLEDETLPPKETP